MNPELPSYLTSAPDLDPGSVGTIEELDDLLGAILPPRKDAPVPTPNPAPTPTAPQPTAPQPAEGLVRTLLPDDENGEGEEVEEPTPQAIPTPVPAPRPVPVATPPRPTPVITRPPYMAQPGMARSEPRALFTPKTTPPLVTVQPTQTPPREVEEVEEEPTQVAPTPTPAPVRVAPPRPLSPSSAASTFLPPAAPEEEEPASEPVAALRPTPPERATPVESSSGSRDLVARLMLLGLSTNEAQGLSQLVAKQPQAQDALVRLSSLARVGQHAMGANPERMLKLQQLAGEIRDLAPVPIRFQHNATELSNYADLSAAMQERARASVGSSLEEEILEGGFDLVSAGNGRAPGSPVALGRLAALSLLNIVSRLERSGGAAGADYVFGKHAGSAIEFINFLLGFGPTTMTSIKQKPELPSVSVKDRHGAVVLKLVQGEYMLVSLDVKFQGGLEKIYLVTEIRVEEQKVGRAMIPRGTYDLPSASEDTKYRQVVALVDGIVVDGMDGKPLELFDTNGLAPFVMTRNMVLSRARQTKASEDPGSCPADDPRETKDKAKIVCGPRRVYYLEPWAMAMAHGFMAVKPMPRNVAWAQDPKQAELHRWIQESQRQARERAGDIVQRRTRLDNLAQSAAQLREAPRY